MATSGTQLKDVGKQRGLEIWRIREFRSGEVVKRSVREFTTLVIHMSFSTQKIQANEQGAAAIITVEIDDALNGLPVQYREVQGHESSLFLSYFKDGIRYLKGGVASGFTHVTDKYENWRPKLFQCKGKEECTMQRGGMQRRIAESWRCFHIGLRSENICLDATCKREGLEKIKGMDQARSIRDRERIGKPEIIVLDSDWNTNDEFWRILGGKEKVKPTEAGGEDENYWQTTNNQLTLWRVSDEMGKMSVKMVSKGNFQYSQLESKDAFMIGYLQRWDIRLDWEKVLAKCTKKGYGICHQIHRTAGKIKKYASGTSFGRCRAGCIYSMGQFPGKVPRKHRYLFLSYISAVIRMAESLIEEICQLHTKDLDGDDVMILDTMKVIYVWIGLALMSQEKKLADNLPNKYLPR
uniref:Gelsolin n=1 Tax=Brugia malayi TaxID=6279 RepID=Q8T4L2_BRUMA|nr:gelsolin [Brugia malayi]